MALTVIKYTLLTPPYPPLPPPLIPHKHQHKLPLIQVSQQVSCTLQWLLCTQPLLPAKMPSIRLLLNVKASSEAAPTPTSVDFSEKFLIPYASTQSMFVQAFLVAIPRGVISIHDCLACYRVNTIQTQPWFFITPFLRSLAEHQKADY